MSAVHSYLTCCTSTRPPSEESLSQVFGSKTWALHAGTVTFLSIMNSRMPPLCLG
jgi:hypothetical protein